MATMTDDDRKERKLRSDKTRAKVQSDKERSKKAFYTKQRETAEEGAKEGDVKAKATRDKIYSKIGRPPGPDADDADVVNKGILSAAAGPDAIGADLGMAGLKMGVGKLLGSGAMKGAEKAVGDFASKFTKGGKSAEKTTGKVSKMPQAKEPMGKANIKNGLTSGKKAEAGEKIDGMAGHVPKTRKVTGSKTAAAKKAKKSADGSTVESVAKRAKGGEMKSRVPKADIEKYEAGKATGAKNRAAAAKQAKADYNKSAKGPKARKAEGNPKTKTGELIDGQTGKTIQTPKTAARPRKAKPPAEPKGTKATKAPKDKADKPAAKKASTSKKKAAEPASKKRSVSRSATGDKLAKQGVPKFNNFTGTMQRSMGGKTIGRFSKATRDANKAQARKEMEERTRKSLNTKEPEGRTVKRSKEGDRLAKMGGAERNMSEGKTVGKMSKKEYLKKERKKRPGLKG